MASIDKRALEQSPDVVEDIERVTLRLVTQSLVDYRTEILAIIEGVGNHDVRDLNDREVSDLIQDAAEDATREALDHMGIARKTTRLFGKTDYKRACYVFQPKYHVLQALFVDSKAEKSASSVRAQLTQTSMQIRMRHNGEIVCETGGIPPVHTLKGEDFLTSTIFVKYVYHSTDAGMALDKVLAIALPNGLLQDVYNPTSDDGIWGRGPNAESRGEKFRIRISLKKLREKARWRIQTIPLGAEPFRWAE